MDSFRYTREFYDDNGLPCVVESAFAWQGDGGQHRHIFGGVNWSAGIKIHSGRSGEPTDLGRFWPSSGRVPASRSSSRSTWRRRGVEYKDRGKTEVAFGANGKGVDDDE